MNTIILKNQLDFQQYQLAVKALADMGIEVAEPEDSFEITEAFSPDSILVIVSMKSFTLLSPHTTLQSPQAMIQLTCLGIQNHNVKNNRTKKLKYSKFDDIIR